MRTVLVLLFLPNWMACSLSMESYQELAAQVRERNRVRYAHAEDALRARGFVESDGRRQRKECDAFLENFSATHR